MANTVHEPPQVDRTVCRIKGTREMAGAKNLVPADGGPRVALDYSPPASSTAIWVVLFAITMMFAAFTSALIVRKGSSLGLADLHSAVDSLLQSRFCSSPAASLWKSRVAGSLLSWAA